nr:odorant receptor 28 [Papilio dardanus]
MEDVLYKPFHETYRLATYAMIIAAIYPNPEKRKIRWFYALMVALSGVPLSIFVMIAIYRFWMVGDVVNVIKQSTVGGPFLGGFLKIFLMNYYEKSVKSLMDEMSADYAAYGTLPARHRVIVDEGIKTSRVYAERGYIVFISFCVLNFPFLASLMNTYIFLAKSESPKYFAHHVAIPFLEPDAILISPYFEIMTAYTTYCAFLYLFNYMGYEVFFGLCINHACLKMQLFCAAMEDAIKEPTREIMREKVSRVILNQCRAYSYIDTIQVVYNIYIGILLFATMTQLCTCMYHVTEGELDPKYIVYTLGTIAYIYIPCRYSSKLRDMSAETATLLYCCGWEAVPDLWPRKALLYMIMRAQRPKEIIAFNMFVFDMERFIAILKSSYSLYTLLRS